MNTLDYLRLANTHSGAETSDARKKFRVNLVTNFTDEIFQKLLKGLFLHNNIVPEIHAVPYKQYHLHLKDKHSTLHEQDRDMTFVFFDANAYRRSSFTEDAAHVREVLEDIQAFCGATTKPVVMMSFLTPYAGVYGNLFTESPLFKILDNVNKELIRLSGEVQNFYVCDVNRLVHRIGEERVRDFRGLYAFDIPFTNDFLLAVAEEWLGYARALMGTTKKCIVVDLDNTLWGGVVGEVGPTGIALGPEYPGLAFQNFQHALLDFYRRGIILAVSSKNNHSDVLEVFEQNPHMILKEGHFAAIKANWDDKAKNLIAIAEELNIGLESIVFLDDDPINRDLVRTMLPMVTVPDLPIQPEQYVPALYALNVFHQLSFTEEDLIKGKMYAEERKRKEVSYGAQSLEEYIAALGIKIRMEKNNKAIIPRLSQLTLKTNQFNLTTRRYSEKEIADMLDGGALIYSGDISDKFGDYGKTIMVIIQPKDHGEAHLDTLLMSCRVMGRGVEFAFLDAIVHDLLQSGINKLRATFVPTAKNKPAEDFLPSLGFAETGRIGDTVNYSINLTALIAKEKDRSIIITQ